MTRPQRPQPPQRAQRPQRSQAPQVPRPTPRTAARPTPRTSAGQPPRPPRQPRASRPAVPPRPPRPPRTLRLGDSTRRLHGALIAAAVLLSLFGGRLLDLQAVQAPANAARAEAGRLRTVELPAARGAITDVHGTVLATSVDARNVTADQTLVTDPVSAATALAPLLGLDAAGREELQQRLTGTKRFVYLARQVTPETWDRIKALELPGVFSEPTTRRVYPAGGLAASVVGFVGREGDGRGGIELAYQKELAGLDGVLTYEAGAGGRQIPTDSAAEQAPLAGSDVRLTIDRDIQWQAQHLLEARVKQANADSGTVVVLDTRTGAIRALATAPTFDPGDLRSAAAEDMGNRALSDVYEPGSTSKIMTAAAVLEEGALRPGSTVVVPASRNGTSVGLKMGEKVFHDHSDHGVERLTFTGVLAKSSNIGTIIAAKKIGKDTLYGYLKRFGIGEPTGLGFPGESRGLLTAPATWSPEQFGTVAFGQGLSLNAVQAASVFATIANNGLRVQPSLVAGTVGPDGTFAAAPAPGSTRVVSPRTAASLRAMLESVVSDEGTAPMARIPGYRVAGKTGTANRVDPACGCYRGYTASFIGFAPADSPRLVVAVTLQNPRNGHYGGRLAGPVFKDVMSFALESMKVPPTGTPAPRLKLTAP